MKEKKEVTLCNKCKTGTYAPYVGHNDTVSCCSEDAPYTDFVDGIKDPHKINCDGKCKFYMEKG